MIEEEQSVDAFAIGMIVSNYIKESWSTFESWKAKILMLMYHTLGRQRSACSG